MPCKRTPPLNIEILYVGLENVVVVRVLESNAGASGQL